MTQAFLALGHFVLASYFFFIKSVAIMVSHQENKGEWTKKRYRLSETSYSKQLSWMDPNPGGVSSLTLSCSDQQCIFQKVCSKEQVESWKISIKATLLLAAGMNGENLQLITRTLLQHFITQQNMSWRCLWIMVKLSTAVICYHLTCTQRKVNNSV